MLDTKQSIKDRRLFWDVVDKIEEAIDSGFYPVGSRLLPERELAEKYGVSRPTIREAMIALEVKERVEVKTGSGVYVTQQKATMAANDAISPYELTQARALFEGEAAALAAVKISDSELKDLAKTIDQMADESKAEAADRAFHLIISKATKNQAIVATIENFWHLRESAPEINRASKAVCANSSTKRMEEHKRIYDALRKHDAQAARSAMHHHFMRLIDALFDVAEAEALEEVRRKNSETRGLYSLNHLVGGN